MEDFLDIIWFKIVVLINYLKEVLDYIFAPLNFLGPVLAIVTIAFLTVALAKFLTKIYKTKRYQELEKQFVYYFKLRQKALQCEDSNKAKLLAKNIDEGKLNKVYYDYFFEGLLNSLLTKYLPIFSFLAYVNEAYSKSNLLALFGRGHIFRFENNGGDPVVIGAAFWFVISILLVYLAWYFAGS